MTGPLNDTAAIQAIQPTFVRGKDGEIIALGRTKQQKMFFMRSSDCGSSWSPMRLVDVPNPNSGIDAARLCDGRILLVYNHATGSAEHWDAGRDVIDVAVSSDGIHWRKELELEREAGKEFSYPAVIQTSDGLVHITYTWKRTKIRHVILNPSSIGSIPFVKRKTCKKPWQSAENGIYSPLMHLDKVPPVVHTFFHLTQPHPWCTISLSSN